MLRWLAVCAAQDEGVALQLPAAASVQGAVLQEEADIFGDCVLGGRHRVGALSLAMQGLLPAPAWMAVQVEARSVCWPACACEAWPAHRQATVQAGLLGVWPMELQAFTLEAEWFVWSTATKASAPAGVAWWYQLVGLQHYQKVVIPAWTELLP